MENFLNNILKEHQIERNKIVDATILKLMHNAKVSELSQSITDLKSQILQIFNMNKAKEEFKEAQIYIPNANAKKEYVFTFDRSSFPLIKINDIKNLDQVGLQFDAEKACIFGTPTNADQIDIVIEFFNIEDENLEIEIKTIPFIVNADPKDLWLNKSSPIDSRFPKEENLTYSSQFLDKKVVVASKRGRSHAHEGTFRDDDFLVKILPDDWAVVTVADGAGSAKFARAGSKFVTEHIVESFNKETFLQSLSSEVLSYFDVQSANDIKIKNKTFIVNSLYKNVKQLHEALNQFADSEEINIKDLHTTLIFVLVKKFDFGYVVLSFGVGDCPINVIDENEGSVKLLNFLDVGEFSGGTRFITMSDIFSRPDMADRFGINCFNDFSKLILMTDGIYDPKFVVESKLENLESWKNFLRDLDGENEDQIKVDFAEDQNIESQLSDWMDFWSKGNHDDRTLAIIY
ncbi:PP2C family serine/threonine-protein phosphatase [Epilithonimonas zeae]|uniref:Protein phosphatase 2C n=1 Tax=Epilithonimonas zeae TaxID=1416779 RepID=A0A1N6INM8_9FLAO|nr:PP2C family serine/threonine-protein phosphatase [Epilithonimonas zeae]SIO33555.1 Protein phosphatase 2C [Epilithonimonas zeae]